MQNQSRVTSTVNPGATGDSQQISFTTPNLSLQGQSIISAATNGNGSAGNIQIQAADSVALSNSTISTQVQQNAIVPRNSSQTSTRSTANQSNITIDTNLLTLDNGARITANTNGQGDAGNILVRNANTIALNQSTISSAVGPNSTGQGGNINLNTNSLNLDNARISARTQAQGRGGDITITARDRINASNSDIETRSESSSSGNITVTAGDIRLRGDSDIRTQVNHRFQSCRKRILFCRIGIFLMSSVLLQAYWHKYIAAGVLPQVYHQAPNRRRYSLGESPTCCLKA
ncbi:hypothetical protein [Leptolyngbya sp. 7M]|uniref:hypothetical protein n=1 Tax=Leptolyngbya sp. 7M TaxID=2812896 RepID=UPI001B8B5C4E|nr:hypothetical protein [Leptolyngbya sp. 7M]QYO64724.1 hypothetical protein JVX88_34860 [Leptolyngbya sp. 7M]